MYERMFIHAGVSKHEDSVLTRGPAKNKHNFKNSEQKGDLNQVKPTASVFTGTLRLLCGRGGFQECAAQVRHWSARRSCRTATVRCRAHVCLSSHFAPFAVVLTCAVHRAAFRPLSLSIDVDKSVRYSATLSAARPIAAKRGRGGRSTNYTNNTQLSKSGQKLQNK